MPQRRFIQVFILVPALLLLFLVFQLISPFVQTIALAVILSSLCYPAYRWILGRLGERSSLAALITCLLIVILVVLPIAVVVVTLVGQVDDVYRQVRDKVQSGDLDEYLVLRNNPYLAQLREGLAPYFDLDKVDLAGAISSRLQQLGLYLIRNSTAIVEGFAGVVGRFMIILITMFFLFRDGPRLVTEIRRLSPLAENQEELLARKFREIIRATVLGTVATAAAQGTVGGIIFWFLGTGNALFWGTAIGFVSIVPVVGTSLVWLPWVVFYLASGAYLKAVVLLVLSVLLVGLIDNVVRPLMIEGQTKMHTMVIFFALLGGVAYFGLTGLIFGPVLVALLLAFLELYRAEFKAELAKPEA